MRTFYSRLALFQVAVLIACTSFAQTNVKQTLTFNKIRFSVNTLGSAFYDDLNAKGSFYDTELEANYLYSSNPWIGGLSPNGQLKLAAMMYSSGGDWTTGPVSANADAASKYNKVYSMTRGLINDHKTKFGQSGYVIPQEILEWPGSGSAIDQEPSRMAPFFDLNGNGKYDPTLGDYPIIKGDMAAFIIRNDNVVHLSSSGEPLKVNMYIMYYAYNSFTAPLDRAVFVDYTIDNVGSQNYSDVYFGVFSDFDLGNHQDDYVGTLVNKDAVYCYNSDNDDEEFMGGFGIDPPSVSQVYLNYSMEGSLAPTSSGSAIGDPGNPRDYYNYMRSVCRDDSPLVYGGDGHFDEGSEQPFPLGAEKLNKCRYMFPNDSDPAGKGTDGNNYGETELWSESTAQRIPGDRRIISSVKLGGLNSNSSVTISTVYLASKTDMGKTIDDTKSAVAGISSIGRSERVFEISPNPANDFITIKGAQAGDRIEILDLTGRSIMTTSIEGEVSTQSLSSGVFLVRLKTKSGSVTEAKKLIVCR